MIIPPIALLIVPIIIGIIMGPTTRFAVQQGQDAAKWLTAKNKIQKKLLTQYDRLRLVNDVLYRTQTSDNDAQLQYVLPAHLVTATIKHMH